MLRGIVIVLFCACWSCLKGNLLVTVIQLSERTPMPFRFVLESTAAGAAWRISWCHKSKENATAGRRQMSLLGVQWNALHGSDLMRVCVSVAPQLGRVDVHAHVQRWRGCVAALRQRAIVRWDLMHNWQRGSCRDTQMETHPARVKMLYLKCCLMRDCQSNRWDKHSDLIKIIPS